MNIALIDQHRLFAEAYVLGHGNATRAAIEAGYSPTSARQTASRLLHLPHIQDAIRRAQAHALKGRMATKALGVLEKILDDENAPAGVRVDAAKTVLDRAGFAAARAPDASAADEKPLHEMSLAELNDFIRNGHLRLAAMGCKATAVIEGEVAEPAINAADDVPGSDDW